MINLHQENTVKLKCSACLLVIYSLWNILYLFFLIFAFDITQEKTKGDLRYYLLVFSLFFIFFCSLLAYFFYIKRHQVNKVLQNKFSNESIMSIFYFIVIIYQSFAPQYYNNIANDYQSYLLNFLSLLILSNIFFSLFKNTKAKILLVVFLSVVWLTILVNSISFQNTIDLIKLILQWFTSISMIIYLIYYQTAIEKTQTIQKYCLSEKKTVLKRQNSRLGSLNKVETFAITQKNLLYKFLNSLNSGILLFNLEMQLMFNNRKMKKFLNKTLNAEKSKLEGNCERELNDDSEKEQFTQNLNKLNNIKCFFPGEKSSYNV